MKAGYQEYIVTTKRKGTTHRIKIRAKSQEAAESAAKKKSVGIGGGNG